MKVLSLNLELLRLPVTLKAEFSLKLRTWRKLIKDMLYGAEEKKGDDDDDEASDDEAGDVDEDDEDDEDEVDDESHD